MTNRWGEKWKQWETLFSWAPKSLWKAATAIEIKRHLLLGRKAMKNLDSVLKRKDITLLTKIHIVKVMVFSVFMYRCESWTIKFWASKNWCFYTVVMRSVLGVPWKARSNQSILKEINPAYSLEGLMLKMKLQYFGHIMQRANSLEKTLTLERLKKEGEEGSRGWDG